MLIQGATKRTFDTGAQRDEKGEKINFSLITPEFKRRLSVLLTRGAKHYGDRNWEKGMPVSVMIESLERHLQQYLEGDDTEDHLAGVAFNLMGIITFEARVQEGKLPRAILDRKDIYDDEYLGHTGWRTDESV